MIMNEELGSHRVWTKVVGSAALGAAAMFVLDPDKGRRRRALARDKVRRIARRTGEVVDAATRDVNGRWHGLRAEATRLLAREDAPDDVLRERVRARLGRVVSHPHAVEVDIHEGRVVLCGPILASEHGPLLDDVRAVPGVTAVEDRLERHETADRIPSLQGGTGRRGTRPELLQDNWTPALRVGAVVGGGFLALCGMRQRGVSGLLMTALGIGLVTRGATNVPFARLAGTTGRRAFDLQKTIEVAAPPQAVFDLWTHYANFPHFMSHVQEVRDLGNGRSHWVVTGPAGATIEWDSVVTRFEPGELIAWRSEPGSTIGHAGSVRFEPTDGGTRITLRMSYNAGGGLGQGIAALLGADPKRRIDDDLMRMKQFVETGIMPHDAAATAQYAPTGSPSAASPPASPAAPPEPMAAP